MSELKHHNINGHTAHGETGTEYTNNNVVAPGGGGAGGYQTGGNMSRFITPGGNPIDTSQPAFPVYHRKFANPTPLGLLG
jgi:hypothetical protein